MAAKQIAFGWYGGKYSHLNWLLPLLPMTTHYCEPFGGSAAVLINRPPAPVETYNVIDRYDSEETLFYCDPPYPHESRGDSKAYRYELTDEQHIELARVLHNVKGKVALSGYHCALLDNLYADWNVCEADSKKVHSVKTERTEVLWTNYAMGGLSGEPGSVRFLDEIGKELDRGGSAIAHRRAWAELLRTV